MVTNQMDDFFFRTQYNSSTRSSSREFPESFHSESKRNTILPNSINRFIETIPHCVCAIGQYLYLYNVKSNLILNDDHVMVIPIENFICGLTMRIYFQVFHLNALGKCSVIGLNTMPL